MHLSWALFQGAQVWSQAMKGLQRMSLDVEQGVMRSDSPLEKSSLEIRGLPGGRKAGFSDLEKGGQGWAERCTQRLGSADMQAAFAATTTLIRHCGRPRRKCRRRLGTPFLTKPLADPSPLQVVPPTTCWLCAPLALKPALQLGGREPHFPLHPSAEMHMGLCLLNA